jgi:hypothetical protein
MSTELTITVRVTVDADLDAATRGREMILLRNALESRGKRHMKDRGYYHPKLDRDGNCKGRAVVKAEQMSHRIIGEVEEDALANRVAKWLDR